MLASLYLTKGTCLPRASTQMLSWSSDGGSTWNKVQDLAYTTRLRTPTSYSIQLPQAARSAATRVMLSQPLHSGRMLDQIAVDNFYVGPSFDSAISAIDAVFNDVAEPVGAATFLFHPNGAMGTYCDRPGG